MKKIFTIALVLVALVGYSQENLVPNATFQEVTKKVKEEGQIELAAPWKSPTLAPADLYVKKKKWDFVGVPENAYGEEKPMEGDNYAGFLAYSYKNKESRSYLQVKLKEKLKTGKEYCVRINVSLADLSKYATSHVGVYLSKDEVSAKNSDVFQYEPQIVSKRLTIYETQFYWTPICGVYKAVGGEEYITIGNFTLDEKLKTKKVKRPRGFTKPQTNDAYYFIDNISVESAEEAGKCNCDAIAGMENAETVTRGFASDKKDTSYKPKIVDSEGAPAPGTVAGGGTENDAGINGMSIGFEAKSFSIGEGVVKKLDKVVSYMKENANVKIKLTGHVDASEKLVEKLDGKRVGSVYKYILSKGLTKDRVERALKGSSDPVGSDKNKNMRVEISVVE